MKKIALILIVLIYTSSYAQQSTSPYEWKWVRDGIWSGAAFGTSAYGFILIQNKDGISEAELNNLNIDDINSFDRWSAGNSSETANKLSDIPFGVAFAIPFGLLLNDDINDHTGQFIGLYLESLATTSALFTVTAGLVNRSRPYVYDENVDLDRRISSTGQRSFYSGHVAASATATFFAAKVYCDFNPDATGKGYIWAGAATIPALVGYFRLQAGQHFLSDILLGYGLGAVTGILVPELHKTKNASVDLSPTAGRNFRGEEYTGLSLRYKF